jgi:hypothetical protein
MNQHKTSNGFSNSVVFTASATNSSRSFEKKQTLITIVHVVIFSSLVTLVLTNVYVGIRTEGASSLFFDLYRLYSYVLAVCGLIIEGAKKHEITAYFVISRFLIALVLFFLIFYAIPKAIPHILGFG